MTGEPALPAQRLERLALGSRAIRHLCVVSRSWMRLLAAVAENVGVPAGAYLLLTARGWAPVWALVGAAGVSVVVLAGQYLRSRELTALGVLVLVRFALGVAVAVITGDPGWSWPRTSSSPR